MPASTEVLVSPEEYLAQERAEELQKHEYRDGEVVPMPGTSFTHTRIVANIIRALGNQLEGSDCEAVSNDLRVLAAGEGKLFTYPDVVVVCGEPAFLDDAFDTLLNPTLLLEVLSPSTKDYDRGGKFARYRALDSLQEYVLVAQDEPLIELYARQPENRWLLSEVRGRSEAVALASIGCRLALSEVYRKVEPTQ